MQTTVTDNGLDTSELDGMAQEADSEIAALQAQIGALEAENAALLDKIANASVEDAATYRQEYNRNKDEISRLNGELSDWQQKRQDITDAQAEAATDNSVATDDYYRIPAIMQDCKTAYNLTWQDEGSWNGYSYVRKATMPNINGVITFKATLSIARKPKYFLGIKIHRAILQISWGADLGIQHHKCSRRADPRCHADGRGKGGDREPAHLRNRAGTPGCDITTEYARSAPQEENATNDTYHLLWSSDRLEIAREVDTRITNIYADLVSLEKMMHYKRSILDVLKDIAPSIDSDQGRRQTLVEECHGRWMENAKNLQSGEEGL